MREEEIHSRQHKCKRAHHKQRNEEAGAAGRGAVLLPLHGDVENADSRVWIDRRHVRDLRLRCGDARERLDFVGERHRQLVRTQTGHLHGRHPHLLVEGVRVVFCGLLSFACHGRLIEMRLSPGFTSIVRASPERESFRIRRPGVSPSNTAEVG